MRKLLIGIILGIIIISSTGCMRYTELNELGIIESMGIDYVNQEYKIGVNLLDAKNKENEEKAYLYVEATGSSIEEVFTNLYLKVNKRLDFAHIKVLIGTKEFFTSDLTSVIEFFLTTKEVRPSFAVLYLKDATIKDVLEKETENSLYDLIERNQKEYGITSLFTFEQLAKRLKENTRDIILPVVKIDEDKIELDSYTYLAKGQIQKELTKIEAKLYNLVTNLTTHYTLNSACEVERFSTITAQNMYVTFSNDKSQFKLSITGDLSIKNNPCQLDQNYLANVYQEILTKDLLAFLTSQQNKGIDLVGMIDYIRKNDYRYYQQEGNDLLSKLTFAIEMNLSLIFKEG